MSHAKEMYDQRLKRINHFEEVDMVQAKKVLGDTACISGGFPVYLLNFGTKQQVVDEVKRLIDGCAGDGGKCDLPPSPFDILKSRIHQNPDRNDNCIIRPFME